jgi:glycosyltransferase involved in cell wall biosynthesis
MKTKLLTIFPRYNSNDTTHYPYWYKLFDEAGKQLDLVVLFESGVEPADSFNSINSIRIQRFQLKPINLLERFILIKNYIQAGYTNVYIHYSYWSVVLVWLAKHSLFRSKQVTIYYWDCEKYETKPKNIILEITLKLADVLVTGHEEVANAYRRVFNFTKPIKIVPNWSESQSVEKIELGTKKKNILYVHNLAPRKGSRLLPEIIKLYLKAQPKSYFHIIGSGPDYYWLKERITEINSTYSNHKIQMYGSINKNKVRSYISSCDMFIMPSTSEGFPRVILEAMLDKAPFVATKVGCVKEIVSRRQQQFLVNPNNVEDFVSKMKTLSLYKNIKLVKDENYKKAKIYSLANSVNSFVKMFS